MKMDKKTEKLILDFVSRETIEKYVCYFDELKKWNNSTRLVQEKTLEDYWNRHILDSIQLLPYIGQSHKIIDIGTGAGFPGMALAISGLENITLCESMLRKCVFLNEIKRLTNTNVDILNKRIEDVDLNHYNLILSRAMTEVISLLGLIKNVSRETKIRFLLHKGKNYETEIIRAKEEFSFSYNVHKSLTSSEGVILEINEVSKLEALS